MKKLLLTAAVAPIALASSAAFAQDTATGDITMNATVPQTCYVATNPTAAFRNITGSTGSSTGAVSDSTSTTITIDSSSIIDPTTATAIYTGAAGSNFSDANRSSVTFTFDAVCNFANSTVTIGSANGGLVNTAPPAFVGDFAGSIAYSTELDWAGSGVGGTTTFRQGNGTNGGQEINGPGTSAPDTVALPTNGEMALEVRLRNPHRAGGNLRAIAAGDYDNFPFLTGTYADTITVRFGANP